MAIVTVGIDLAKNVFAVHGVDEFGKPALVRMMAPKFVIPYRTSGKRGKNDAADAAATHRAHQPNPQSDTRRHDRGRIVS